MVTGGAGKLSVHGRDEVILGSLEHSKIGLRQGQQRGGYCLDILVLLHVLWWVLRGDTEGEGRTGNTLRVLYPC